MARDLGFLVGEFKDGREALRDRGGQRRERNPGELDDIAAKVTTVMIVKSQAVTVRKRHLPVRLREKKKIFIFNDRGIGDALRKG